jgi:CRP-like cAMP-binding protein
MVSVDQIRNYPLFDGLNEAELARLAGAIVKRSFARGAYVFYPGSPAVNAYLVESGLVRMFFCTVSGQEILLNLAGPPEAFSLPTLLDSQLRVIGASALIPTVLLSIGREDFFQVFDSSPQFARNVYRTLLIISRKLLLHTRMLATLNLNGRLATMLLRLAIKSPNQDHIIQVPISQEDFAGWVGASRGRLNQAMKRLQQVGLIEVQGQKVTILDYPGLERLAEEQTIEKL